MVPYIKSLTPEIEKKFGDRKKTGLISFIYNAKKDEFAIVLQNNEHIDTAVEILKVKKSDIERNPEIASHLIPINIKILGKEIKEILIGISSIELGYHVRHTKKDLIKARNATWELVRSSEYQITKNIKINIITTNAKT